MELSPIFSPQGSNAPAESAKGTLTSGSAAMGKEQFLNLLVTQLKNQDPLNPQDGHEFAAQLAQFSSVEQLMNIDKSLNALGSVQSTLAQSMNSGVAAGLIGRTIESEGNQVGWEGSGTVPLSFELGAAAKTVKVTVRDANGTVVKTFDVASKESGKHTLEWDGKNASGARVASGTYTFQVEALDGKQEPIPSQTFVRGKVDRISFGPEGIMAWIGRVSVSMATVRSVEETP